MKKLYRLIFKILRIDIDTVNIPPEAKKCVLLFAPHTSASDFLVGHMALILMGVPTVFVIKKEAFWFPLGNILRSMGGLPIDRKHVRKFPVYAAKLIKDHESIAFLIAPEGTRTRTEWKKGFYTIAELANVPIALGYLDYKSRKGGICGMFYPTGDYDKDLQEIEKNYYGMHGLNANQFNLEDYPYAHPDWLKK